MNARATRFWSVLAMVAGLICTSNVAEAADAMQCTLRKLQNFWL